MYDKNTDKIYWVEVPVWNATIANLSLMALGSSAPEILLSVLETIGSLGEKAGELGPSTIVGSAAFNLLFISAVCIPAVDEPKKIADLGVFITTAIFSLFAYIWLLTCLSLNSYGVVTSEEAWLTLMFFFILLILAFSADKYNERKLAANKTKEEKAEDMKKDGIKMMRANLRQFAKSKGEDVVLGVAQGIKNALTAEISEEDKREVVALFQQILGVNDLTTVSVKELHEVL